MHGGLIPRTLLSYPRSHPRILKICTNRIAYLLVLYVNVVCSYALFQLKLECYLPHFHPCLKIPHTVFKLSNLGVNDLRHIARFQLASLCAHLQMHDRPLLALEMVPATCQSSKNFSLNSSLFAKILCSSFTSRLNSILCKELVCSRSYQAEISSNFIC